MHMFNLMRHSLTWYDLTVRVFCTPDPYLQVQGHERHEKPSCQQRLRQRTHWALQPSVCCSLLSLLIYQRGTLFSLSLLANVPIETLFVIFQFSSKFNQVQFHQVQLHLGFPDHTSVCPYSIPVLFSGHPSLLPLSVLFLLFPLFDQQVLAQPRCFPASSDWLLMLEEAHSHTLKAPMSLKTVSRGIPSTDS